ncbi:hypothetical protein COW99_04830 [Candidatus Roizmanbacteria bacterium CG22_combo_CG10-13_8_21_14_all_38_20]|uniref:Prolipoprotein diacylglyceryl transferase n=1 Tax=Candidatus Roizmanbacteria bacterium CG22_combo_CG10-13_8_21_14_all_38_20 TaxID=1974862 RepID=A0A2H0BUT9_9BACT|nr:prolipoprotein diacylglyceryl transferase [Candidatus Microgenomates bacterium]PIP61309.1 MAG: hypothetical protein COW99_04830 [Candidatus Roizmanbacteria bacterium CG22_combo_CG10-13_8_21_14_all_38_20]
MLPTLLQLGPIRIASFSVFILLAFLASTFIVWRTSKREYLSEEKTMDLYLLSVVWGIVGARLSYVLLYPEKFGLNILRILLPSWMPGFYTYGGLVAAVISVIVLSRKHEASYKKYLDIFAPALILSVGLYKIGQFLDGSLIGISTNIPYFGMLTVVGEAGHFVPLALIQAIIYFAAFYLITNKWSRYFLITRKLPMGIFLTSATLVATIESFSFFLTRDKLFISVVPISLVIVLLILVISASMLYRLTRKFKQDKELIFKFLKKLTRKKVITADSQ